MSAEETLEHTESVQARLVFHLAVDTMLGAESDVHSNASPHGSVISP